MFLQRMASKQYIVWFPVWPFFPQHSEVQFRSLSKCGEKCTINQPMSWIVMSLESIEMKNLHGIIPISWVFKSVLWSTHYNRPFICYANSRVLAPAKQRKAYNEAGEGVVWGGYGCTAGLLRMHRLRHVTGSCHCNDHTNIDCIINWATQKPWMTDEVHKILNTYNSAFKSSSKEALRTARANWNHARLPKRAHSQKNPLPQRH